MKQFTFPFLVLIGLLVAGPAVAHPQDVKEAKKVYFSFKGAGVRSVMRFLAEEGGVNILIPPELEGTITLNVDGVAWSDALDDVAKTVKHVAVQEPGRIRVIPRTVLNEQMESRVICVKKLQLNGPGLKLLRICVEQSMSRSVGGKRIGMYQYDEDHQALVVTDTVVVLDKIAGLIQVAQGQESENRPASDRPEFH